MYTGTVRQHDGQFRYTLKYFEEFLHVSANQTHIHILLTRPAQDGSGRVIALTAFVVGKAKGSYLNGGYKQK